MAIGKYNREYWRGRLAKREHKLADGTHQASSEYAVQIQFQGQRKWFNTHTSNKDIAAERVVRFYEMLHAKGNWEEAKKSIFPEKSAPKNDISVGDYIDAVLKTCTKNGRTIQIYIQKFRTLVADICGISRPKEACYAKGKAYQEWLARIHRVKLMQLTAQKLQAWKKRRIEEFSQTPVQEASTRHTINSTLRNVKSLFAESIRKNVDMVLPNPLFIDGVELESVKNSPYVSKIPDLGDFLQAAREKLHCHAPGSTEHEAYKIILLALLLGLRRDEIDTLTWDQVDFVRGKVNVCTNEFTSAKTHGSERTVDVSDALLRVFEELRKNFPDDIFVIHNQVQPNTSLKTQHHYRCYRIFRFAAKWLNENGIGDKKPLHALRKEYGSEITKNHGIYAASTSLGHSDIRLTRNTYVGQKERYVVDCKLD